MRAREADLMFKKLIAVAFGAIFAVSLAVSPGANAEDAPFIKSGKAKFIQGYYRGAIADYDRAIMLNPSLAEAHYNQGVAKSKLGDHDGAEADRQRAIELDPEIEDR